ncbi:MAG: hypothetical protein QOD75_3504 [Blastocatellia bacterium]|nr:hypothetical protein [Blastocatellia bacterium]
MSVCRPIPAGRALGVETRHCEERSDEAIQSALAALDCFAEPVIGPAKPDPLARNGHSTIRHHALVLRADLHRFHAGFGFGPGLERPVVDHGRRRSGRLLVDDGAFLRRRIAYHVKFRDGRLRKGRRDSERSNGSRNQKFLHVSSSLVETPRKPAALPKVPGV